MSDYPMLISNKLHSFRNFTMQTYIKICDFYARPIRKEQFFKGNIGILLLISKCRLEKDRLF